MCCHCLLPVTPEAAGSSPVDPANYPSENKGFPFLAGACLRHEWITDREASVDDLAVLRDSASIRAVLGGVTRHTARSLACERDVIGVSRRPGSAAPCSQRNRHLAAANRYWAGDMCRAQLHQSPAVRARESCDARRLLRSSSFGTPIRWGGLQPSGPDSDRSRSAAA